MRRPNLTRYVCILAASTMLAAAPAKADDANAEAKKAIRTVLDDQVAAWNKRDLEGFMAGYWKSPKLTFSSGNSKIAGWQGTFDRYKQRYQSEGREMGKLAFSELEIEPLGPDSAFVRGRFQLEMAKESPTGLFTLIFKKMPEGWRIIHDHTSTDPAPPKKPQ